MVLPLGNAEEMTIADEASEFHGGEQVIPFFEDEFEAYWWVRWKTAVVGVVEVMGDEVGGFKKEVDILWGLTFQCIP